MNSKQLYAVGLVLLLPLIGMAKENTRIEDSVVKIVNQSNQFDWYTPWNSGSTGKGTGSGFVISKKRIMTNAHVVSDAALLLVYFHNDPNPYPAHITAISHESDLAILELESPERLKDVPELPLSTLPALRSQVTTYGYPAGGKLISNTVGIVSRIETQTYVHSGVSQFLAVQTDAAINPGNSGGPVLQKGKVVGVAFQGNSSLENMGFFIPTQIVKHFLEDIADGKHDGFPSLQVLAVNLENKAARDYAGLTEKETGIRIENILKGSCMENDFKVGDIITSCDGYPVANDGSIVWNKLRLSFDFLSNLKQVGDKMSFGIIRGEKRLKVSIKLNDHNPVTQRAHLYDTKPKFYIYCGLVFAPLNRETLKTYSENWIVEAPQELVYETYFRPLIENDHFDAPRVLQIRKLSHEANAEESNFLYRLIDTVNGKKIETLSDLIDAFENNTADQHEIHYLNGNRSTYLDRESADTANQEILQRYAIPMDRRL